VQFHLLSVYRDNRRSLDAVFDKEVIGVLADCGSRMVLTTDYRFQKGDALTPPPIVRVPSAEVAPPGSTADIALTAVCKTGGSADQLIANPYAWAKQRLRGSAK
jgi:hypothetical protein